jgi:hypothetical protein
VGLAHENNSHAEVTRRSKSAVDFHVRGVVTSHGVENDLARQRDLMLRVTSHKLGLALFYRHDFATFVMAAFGANAVWQAGLTTIRAQRSLGGTQGIVRATFVSTSFGMSSLRIWHNYSVFNNHNEAQKAQTKTICAFCASLWLKLSSSEPPNADRFHL